MDPRKTASFLDRSGPINELPNSCIENWSLVYGYIVFGFLSYRQQNWLTHVALCTPNAQQALSLIRTDQLDAGDVYISLLTCGFKEEALPFGGVWFDGRMIPPYFQKIRYVKLKLAKLKSDRGPKLSPFAIMDSEPLAVDVVF